MDDENDLEACWADVRGPVRRTPIQTLIERILRAGAETEITLREFLLLLDNYRFLIEKIPAPGEEVLFMGVRIKFKAAARQD